MHNIITKCRILTKLIRLIRTGLNKKPQKIPGRRRFFP